MQRLRATAIRLSPYHLGKKTLLASLFAVPPLSKRPRLCDRFPSLIRNVSISVSTSGAKEFVVSENTVQQEEVLLSSVDDLHGGVIVNVEQPLDSMVFAPMLKASISHWTQQGKRGVWIKLPIQHANLVEAAVKEGFRYHHAEPDYLMLVYWIPETTDMLPANASHRVGIGAFVMNSQGEVLVVQEKNGKFKGKGLWKFPTGVVEEGEDICTAAIREVKEETGIETEFEEVLAFRQSHKSFFRKSDLFFVCMLRPRSFDIQKQTLEIEAAQWMPFEDYAAQPFVRENEMFNYVAKICIAKSENDDVAGFSPLSTTTASGQKSYLYFCRDLKHLLTCDSQQRQEG
ncbi:nudix hydrolase 2-like [Juglans microcarpa x Juglans regia]|uniref:nudix hydrolase 2-like n=1 Tax=Juglans microcarpa x Juglans regia TaxID=2249226 RepID=UPI001B7DE612|nr:nudix hydrolase 2-like [Juglans microcarpa x Juglans regia]